MKPHALDVDAWAVRLVVDEARGGGEREGLRDALHEQLHPMVEELHPNMREPWYEFHVSLVGEVTEAAAERITLAATEAGWARTSM